MHLLNYKESEGANSAVPFSSNVQILSGVLLASNSDYRNYSVSCTSYFIKGIKNASFYGGCVNEESHVKDVSGMVLETKIITINASTIVDFDWDSYGCDFIIAEVSVTEPSVTYFTSTVSITTV